MFSHGIRVGNYAKQSFPQKEEFDMNVFFVALVDKYFCHGKLKDVVFLLLLFFFFFLSFLKDMVLSLVFSLHLCEGISNGYSPRD